jgi:hypothetical protein
VPRTLRVRILGCAAGQSVCPSANGEYELTDYSTCHWTFGGLTADGDDLYVEVWIDNSQFHGAWMIGAWDAFGTYVRNRTVPLSDCLAEIVGDYVGNDNCVGCHFSVISATL